MGAMRRLRREPVGESASYTSLRCMAYAELLGGDEATAEARRKLDTATAGWKWREAFQHLSAVGVGI